MNMIAIANQVGVDRSWQATLDLQLERSKLGTRLTRCRHCGPLYVQKPFYPEGRDYAHIYLLHPPGGIVSGDCLDISIEVKPQAAALITTPGAARIYRAREEQPLQRQRVHLIAGQDATLEWFPLETIVFSGACVELNTTIELTQGSHFIGWELTCFGLPASSEPFLRGRFQQHYQVCKDGIPLFVDRMVVAENRQQLLFEKAGMQGNPVSGFFLAGPMDDDSSVVLAVLREQLDQGGFESVAAISKVGEFYVGRYLGGSAEQGRKIFTRWWQYLRPLMLGRKACPPRIWST